MKCNEVGFTEENVRAICKINDSTKKANKGVDDGCIGEKGIGILFSHGISANRIQALNPFFPFRIVSRSSRMDSTFASTNVDCSEGYVPFFSTICHAMLKRTGLLSY